MGDFPTKSSGPSLPVSVANGGTGGASLTAHGVLVGEGTSPIAALAVGADGTVLQGASGADPSFTAAPVLTSVNSPTNTTLLIKSNQANGANPQVTIDSTNAVASANPMLRISTAGVKVLELQCQGSTHYLQFYDGSSAATSALIFNNSPGVQLYNAGYFYPYLNHGPTLGGASNMWASCWADVFGARDGGVLASSATIAPTAGIHTVSGTTTINTISLPATNFTGSIVLIPTGLWSTGTSGNIAIASTAVVNKALIMTYSSTTAKWHPSY